MNINNKKVNSPVDCIVVTSTSIRHKYFAIRILKEIPNSYVIFENRDRTKYYQVEMDELMHRHFDNLFRAEESYFSEKVSLDNNFLDSRTLGIIEKNEINQSNFANIISKINPKCISLYSVSIIKQELISLFSKRLFNIHAGLSPYYRGTATNIWPIINDELEYIGMTIHHVDSGIDSGGIIIQDRPKLEVEDDSHTMACKNTEIASHLMVKTINRFVKTGSVPNVKQDLSKGKQFFFKDFDLKTVENLNSLIGKGIVKTYLQSQKEIDLISW